MHEIEIVAIWVSVVIAVMILTMLMPRMCSESRGREVRQHERERIPAHQEVHEQVGSMVPIPIAKEA